MRKLAALSAIVLSLSACAVVSSQYRLGARAEMNQQYDDAIAYYGKATLEDPRDAAYRAALQRAKVRAAIQVVRTARELAGQGKKDEALAAYAKAQSYNPRDPAIAREARLLTMAQEKTAETKPEKIEFPIKLKTKDEPLQLKFPVETSIRSIFLALGRAAGISLIFDENFRDVPYMIDLSNMTFEQALRSLCTASRNFSRIIDERTVLVIPDNAMKRLQYEVNCIRTFYLANITAQEIQAALSAMLRSTTRVPNIVFDKNLNSLTIRSTPQEIELVEKLLRVWDKPKGEVVIDLEIMEVSRLKLRELGVSFGDAQVGLKYGDVGSDTTSTGWNNLGSIDFSKVGNFSISLPTSYLDLLESDADTKIIAQPRLPGVSDEEMRHLVGQKIPIPQTSFYSIAAGGVSQQPVTSFTQQDVGIEIKIKPTIHRGDEVTLALEIKVTSVGGTGYANIPIINTREIKNTIRLRDGETSLLAGLLKDEERRTIKGIAGLKDIPLLGRLFSSENTTIEQSDVILTVTPYIIRNIPITAEDAKPLWVDVDTSSLDAGLPPLLEDELMGRPINPGLFERNLQARNLPGAGGTNSVQLLPASFEAPVGRDVRVSVNLRSDEEIGNMSLNISYNPQQLNLKDVSEGGLVRQFGGQPSFLKNIDNNSGICTVGFSSPQVGKGIRGGGTIATLVFEAKAAGEGMVTVTNVSAMGANGMPVTLQLGQSRIVVR
jgi:general secretion pathway protein D